MDAKTRYVFYAPCAVAPFSIVGSLLTLLTLHRTPDSSQLRTYHRLLTGISILDLIMSFAMAMGPLPIPADEQVPGARGNQATCTAQALFLQVGVASVPYSCMMVIYFVLVIRYNISKRTIATRIEPFMHALPLLFHVGTAALGLAWEIFNYQGSFCWVAPAPIECSFVAEIECERGSVKRADIFGLWLLAYPMMAYTGIILISLMIVCVTVWSRFKKSQRFVFEGSAGNSYAEKQTRQLVAQSLLYAGSFLNMTIWGSMGTILYLADVSPETVDKNIWIAYLATFFFPLQGLFNFLIFIRPRYLSKRELHSDQGRFYALRQAVWNPTTTHRPNSSQERSYNLGHRLTTTSKNLRALNAGSDENSQGPSTSETANLSTRETSHGGCSSNFNSSQPPHVTPDLDS